MVRFLLIFVAVVNSVFAIPQLINYQGQLTSPGGAPLDTTVTMTFKLYSVASGGTSVWTETYSPVIVSEGLFNVQLGLVTPLPDLFDVNRWLGVTVGNNTEMSPRQQVVSVAHAYRVGTVDGASGGYISSPVLIQGDLQVGDANTTTGAEGIVVGSDNILGAYRSSITGGSDHVIEATAHQAHIGGGVGNLIQTSQYGTIGGGAGNVVNANYGTVSGGRLNSSGNECFVGGGVGNRCAGYENAIVGGGSNRIDGAGISVISGGGGCIIDSIVAGTISGGHFNRVSADYGMVGGGFSNHAAGQFSIVGGGNNCHAINLSSAVGGGGGNWASGQYSTVPGGYICTATGDHSFASGWQARANHTGAFVWGSSWLDSTVSFGAWTFTARSPGGVRFYTANSGTAVGVNLPSGGGAWASLCDVNQKRLHGLANGAEVLSKIASLPIHRWSYLSQDETTQHLGPTAQDFHAAFGLGDDNTTISTVDPDGVLFAAVQELAKRNAELTKVNERQEMEIAELKRLVNQVIALGNK